MAKRVLISGPEELRLVKVLAETKDWEKAKLALPDVDPKALDKGWKEFAFKKAGLPLDGKPERTLDPKRKARVDAIVEAAVKAGEKKPSKKEIESLYFEAPDSALDDLEKRLTDPTA